jgi:hypothetical protein
MLRLGSLPLLGDQLINAFCDDSNRNPFCHLLSQFLCSNYIFLVFKNLTNIRSQSLHRRNIGSYVQTQARSLDSRRYLRLVLSHTGKYDRNAIADCMLEATVATVGNE